MAAKAPETTSSASPGRRANATGGAIGRRGVDAVPTGLMLRPPQSKPPSPVSDLDGIRIPVERTGTHSNLGSGQTAGGRQRYSATAVGDSVGRNRLHGGSPDVLRPDMCGGSAVDRNPVGCGEANPKRLTALFWGAVLLSAGSNGSCTRTRKQAMDLPTGRSRLSCCGRLARFLGRRFRSHDWSGAVARGEGQLYICGRHHCAAGVPADTRGSAARGLRGGWRIWRPRRPGTRNWSRRAGQRKHRMRQRACSWPT